MFFHTSVEATELKMSGGKANDSKQHEDTTTDASLVALHLTHREATLLFAMAARHGATDSQSMRTRLPMQRCLRFTSESELTVFYPLLHTPRTKHSRLRLCSLYYLQCIVKSEVSFPSSSSWIEIGFQT